LDVGEDLRQFECDAALEAAVAGDQLVEGAEDVVEVRVGCDGQMTNMEGAEEDGLERCFRGVRRRRGGRVDVGGSTRWFG